MKKSAQPHTKKIRVLVPERDNNALVDIDIITDVPLDLAVIHYFIKEFVEYRCPDPPKD